MKSTVRIRLLCLLLCLAVLAPCASALSETTKVTGYLLRLREGASTDSKVIDAYPRGTKVTILKKGDTWTKVSVKDKEGYMMTCYLAYSKDKPEEEKNGDAGRKSSSATSSSSSSKSSGSSSSASSKASKNEKSSSSGSTMYIEKGARVNFREEANSDSAVIDSYRGGTIGYIATEFLTDEK